MPPERRLLDAEMLGPNPFPPLAVPPPAVMRVWTGGDG